MRVLFLLFTLSAALFLEREDPIALPSGWRRLEERASPDFPRRLSFAIPRENTQDLEDLFWDVSDPRKPGYGQYLSIEEIGLRFPADPTTVTTWLTSEGITWDVTVNGDYVFAEMTTETAARLFGCEFHLFQHATGRQHVSSLGPYSIPTHLVGHVEFVSGLVGFPLTSDLHRPKLQSSSSTAEVDPKILRTRYNVTDVGQVGSNQQAVAEFQEQYFSPSDLKQFQTKFQVPVQPVAKIVGQNSPGDPGTEAGLDIQYIMGIGQNISSWFWSTPNFDFWDDLTSWSGAVLNTSNAPWVHSISYGSQGSYPSTSYRERLNDDFQTMGVRGMSIIFASGDSGTGCSLCYSFQPSFPAVSPYVTAVGATTFASGTSGPEVAVTEFGSGGGMDLLFTAPSYQQAAVNAYFSSSVTLPDAHFYNRNGRGTPDVAAMGQGFAVVVDGGIEIVAGTSCAAPTFAGIVSLLNDQQLQAGKPTLGFLNNWLYQIQAANPNAFFDVTEGDNQYACCGYTGFNAYRGWDPVTGLGTPNYAVMKTLLP